MLRNIFTLSLVLSLSACQAGQINSILNQIASTPTTQTAPNLPTGMTFSKALSRRTLPLNSATTNNTQNSNSSQNLARPLPASAPTMAAPAIAPAPAQETAKLAPDMASGMPGRMIMPWYGGGEFNQYVIQFAEESIFPASTATTLLEAYETAVKPILAEWDSNARLIESRAHFGMENSPDFIEYISLPGRDGEPEQIRPNYIFRFASTPRKETLNIYLLPKETRVHRLVWGEPRIDLKRVKIDSDEAQRIALKAFSNRDNKPGYPVYPDPVSDPNMKVIYDIPENPQWQIQLNQQGDNQNRYFVSVSFEVKPPPQNTVSPPPLPEKPGTRCFIEPAMPEYPSSMRVWGSVELDAATGEIKNMSRPVMYLPVYAPAYRCEEVPPTPLPEKPEISPEPLPVEESPTPPPPPSSPEPFPSPTDEASQGNEG